MPRKNSPHRREQRRLEAAVRQDEYDQLSTQAKLDALPEGQCERQRVRLTAQLAKEQPQ